MNEVFDDKIYYNNKNIIQLLLHRAITNISYFNVNYTLQRQYIVRGVRGEPVEFSFGQRFGEIRCIYGNF